MRIFPKLWNHRYYINSYYQPHPSFSFIYVRISLFLPANLFLIFNSSHIFPICSVFLLNLIGLPCHLIQSLLFCPTLFTPFIVFKTGAKKERYFLFASLLCFTVYLHSAPALPIVQHSCLGGPVEPIVKFIRETSEWQMVSHIWALVFRKSVKVGEIGKC